MDVKIHLFFNMGIRSRRLFLQYLLAAVDVYLAFLGIGDFSAFKVVIRFFVSHSVTKWMYDDYLTVSVRLISSANCV